MFTSKYASKTALTTAKSWPHGLTHFDHAFQKRSYFLRENFQARYYDTITIALGFKVLFETGSSNPVVDRRRL